MAEERKGKPQYDSYRARPSGTFDAVALVERQNGMATVAKIICHRYVTAIDTKDDPNVTHTAVFKIPRKAERIAILDPTMKIKYFDETVKFLEIVDGTCTIYLRKPPHVDRDVFFDDNSEFWKEIRKNDIRVLHLDVNCGCACASDCYEAVKTATARAGKCINVNCDASPGARTPIGSGGYLPYVCTCKKSGNFHVHAIPLSCCGKTKCQRALSRAVYESRDADKEKIAADAVKCWDDPTIDAMLTSHREADEQAKTLAGLLPCSGCTSFEKRDEPKFKKCGRCLRVVYCSAECQKADWKKHKLDCTTTQ